jgi:hypothetical protein
MFKSLLKTIPVSWQMKLPLSVRLDFYQKELLEYLELCAALIRDEKVRTFQAAIRLIRQEKKEPLILIDYLFDVESSLFDGDSIYDAVQLENTSFLLDENEPELAIINNTTQQTSEFPLFKNTEHDWGEDELESKLAQLWVGILIWAAKKRAVSCRLSWQDCDKDLGTEELGHDLPMEGFEEFFKTPGEVFMTYEKEEFKVFDLPGSLIQPMINISLGLADLPYWVKKPQKGNFTLKAERNHFEVSLHYQPEEKQLNFCLNFSVLSESELAED